MEITEIKSRLTIIQVLSHYNLLADKNNRLRCPWHEDKTPSLQIYPKTNTWTCFSSNCNAGSGDVIDMVMKLENVTKHKALLKCKTLIGESPKPIKPKPSEQTSEQAILTKFYRQLQYKPGVASHVAAKNYLESRGIGEIQVSYCSSTSITTWKRRSPAWYSSIESNGLTRYKDCIVFALRDRDGHVVGLYGRKIKQDKAARHYYLSGAHQGLYPCWPSSMAKTIILTESVIDAASLSQIKNVEVLALYGASGLTPDHTEAVSQLSNLQEVILFMDGDDGGEKAVPALIEKLQVINDKIQISKVNTPQGEDANSILVQGGVTQLESLIASRTLLYSSIEEPSSEETTTTTTKSDLDSSNPELLHYKYDDLHITILGGIKITGLEKLRVTLKIEKQGSTKLSLRESLDLYNSRAVDQLTNRISDHYEIGGDQSSKVIGSLIDALEGYRASRLELLQTKKVTTYQLSEVERTAAMKYLKTPELMARTLRDINASGVVGEEANALIGHIIYLSRKRSKPLHVMYLGRSGSGKTYLQEKLAELIPTEDKKSVTALSDQSLYYQGKQLKGKVLFIEDIDGAENVMYVIRELQTKGSVSKTVVWKDPRGNMQSIDVTAEGPLCISSCTTHEKVYEDNANRCILLYIDDSSNQDARIMDYQRKASAGKVNARSQDQMKQLHQNVQRLLRPIKVINPYAELIELPIQVFRPRRSLQLLLGFIETVTFYHQHQRPLERHKETGETYISTTIEDITLSFDLLKPVLFTKSDELSNACRKFLEKLKKYVATDTTFYTQEIRKKLRLSSSTIHRYVGELKRNGYLIYKGGNRNRGYEYEIKDYDEYEQLKGAIDRKLEEILEKVRDKAVSRKYPTTHNGTMKSQIVNELA